MSERKVRVRFAPSPTGPLHMGGIRTALYNYLFAKKNNGDFILRIEDTDQNRYVEGAEEYIIKALNWCKLSIDEGPGLTTSKGPYRQSERKHLYKKYVDQLIESGHAYYAFDSSEELTEMRELAKKLKCLIGNIILSPEIPCKTLYLFQKRKLIKDFPIIYHVQFELKCLEMKT